MERKRWRRTTAALCAVGLVAAACGDDDGPVDPEDVQTGVGVTDEPCPDAIDQDKGCIYLGYLTDLTGVFAVVGTQWQEAQRDFWRQVNEAGGIAGQWEVDIDTYLRDTAYDPTQHAASYREIEGDILALGTTLGTPHTEAILDDMVDDEVVGIPATLWSGWHFSDNVIDLGQSYCLQSAIHLDWAHEQQPIGSLISVAFPGDYGGDVATGASLWAEAAGVEDLGFVETGPTAAIGSQDAAIGQILASDADAVVLGVSPVETAEIVGGAVASGFQGRFIGAIPTWDAGLVPSPAMPALEVAYTQVSGLEPWDADTQGHSAMREALGDQPPVNEYYTLGWYVGYAMRSLLETAAAAGDLTRSGLVAAASDLEIDFEGMTESVDFRLDVNERLNRTAVISQPDADAPLGLRVLDADASGPISADLAFERACVGG